MEAIDCLLYDTDRVLVRCLTLRNEINIWNKAIIETQSKLMVTNKSEGYRLGSVAVTVKS